jgi:S-adenosylmethionine hydrolase
VGSARAPLLVQADHRWYLGPDNGLFVPVVRRAATVEVRQISWRPPRLSASFHGRDLFAPVAAQLAHGRVPDGASMRLTEPDPTWPEDLAEVLYLDRFGNAITGLRAETLPPAAGLEVRGTLLARARTYADVAPGALFWHENSNGLAEIAAHGAPAAEILKIPIGQRVGVVYK